MWMTRKREREYCGAILLLCGEYKTISLDDFDDELSGNRDDDGRKKLRERDKYARIYYKE